ncbi:energy-coupling factor transporter transmembrane component T [Cereibacter johrii]|uniref:energy-coupling factor transporter transmembrane component T n=1 Tax=Cereibacter johrii TaxID=445629 RepID=UPI000DCCFF56|nr:energy-coupling factor transporter transmembrane component T [Cereibacter johrii]RAZ87649.1 energy-coupling factor transporter transmembrane protein EcfT [Cereibacter johrii]
MLTLTSPIETRLHRLPAGAKLTALALAAVALVPLDSLPLLAPAALATALLYGAQGGAFARHGLALLRPLWPFLLILALWHGWTGELARGCAVALKLLIAVALANLVTMTTRLDDMIAVLERLARPLQRLGLAPHVLAISIALVIRFTPVLLARAERLAEAWRARSPRRPSWRIVAPLALGALDDAEQVAEALRARGGL